MSWRAIAVREAAGWLHEVHRGVFAVGRPELTWLGRCMAAVLACGPAAALSHISAAALLGLLARHAGAIHLTAPGQRGRKAAGIALHRSALGPGERWVRAGIPVTRGARTLVDLADVVSRRELERAVDEAEYLRLDCTGLAPRHGRRGAGRLAAVLAEHRPGSTRTESPLEEAFVALCDRHGLERPELQAWVEDVRVDALFRAVPLAVELDGRGAHLTASRFERDRARDAHLLAARVPTVRITRRRLAREPGGIVSELLRIGVRRAAPNPSHNPPPARQQP
jgi:very-short-patch-repair endonuclease